MRPFFGIIEGENSDMKYTFDTYRKILEKLIADYEFKFFEEFNPNKCVYLRHDIDIMPENITILMNIERELGVRSTWFFQPNNRFYNIFSEDMRILIETLLTHNFSIGLHIDCQRLESLDQIQEEVSHWFHFCSRYYALSPIVSFHRPKPYLLANIHLSGFVNTYEESFFQRIRYFSDSKRKHFLEPLMSSIQRDRSTSIQLLTHPYWWDYEHLDIQSLLTRYENIQLSKIRRVLAQETVNYEQYLEGRQNPK